MSGKAFCVLELYILSNKCTKNGAISRPGEISLHSDILVQQFDWAVGGELN